VLDVPHDGRYFETMGVGLVAGRLFESGDRADSLPVLIVDDVLAGDWWGSPAAAIGQRVRSRLAWP
jgi:hypothetical protein